MPVRYVDDDKTSIAAGDSLEVAFSIGSVTNARSQLKELTTELAASSQMNEEACKHLNWPPPSVEVLKG